jgi:hypothetical protein
MFPKLVSRNPDLRRLVERGYAVAFDDAPFLIVRDIPYLTASGELAWGAIVTKLVFVTEDQVQQDDHQIFFAGGHPHGLDGKPIGNLGGGAATLALSKASSDVVVQRSFSNKPRDTGVFADFFEKIESYVAIISGPAIAAHGANLYTFRIRDDAASNSVFKIQDTLTSRAEIVDLAAKFEDEVLAIVGLGGTGAYLLDMAVRTPVKEVRGYDADDFHVHNAFRAPGRLDPATELGQPKVAVHAARYENFRHGLRLERKYIDLDSGPELEGATFAFVCVDKGSARAAIWDLLIPLNIPFIDVGLGLRRRGDGLGGMVRLTYVAAGDPRGLRQKGYAEMADGGDDLYRTNIQIGELNALNACLALIRYKQLRGFYGQTIAYDHLLMDITDLKTAGEGPDDEV